MKRLVVLAVALAVLGVSNGEVAAQKKKKEVEALMKVLKSDKDAKKRLAAAQQIYQIGEVRAADARPATEVLVAAFKSDGDVNVRIAAGNALSVIEPDSDLVLPIVLEILKDEKENNGVLRAGALIAGSFGGKAKEAAPALLAIKKREEAKPENMRDGNLLGTVNTALQYVSK